jgi:hypothetical protein
MCVQGRCREWLLWRHYGDKDSSTQAEALLDHKLTGFPGLAAMIGGRQGLGNLGPRLRTVALWRCRLRLGSAMVAPAPQFCCSVTRGQVTCCSGLWFPLCWVRH